MKIHTSLTQSEMYNVLTASGAPIGYQKLEAVGSRTHAHGYHVTLKGTGFNSNLGWVHGDTFQSATWDEWGAFFGALFAVDPAARCGGTLINPVYRNASHFHYLTGHRFEESDDDKGGYLPADTHKRHKWEGRWSNGLDCTKCSAKRPPFISGKEWS